MSKELEQWFEYLLKSALVLFLFVNTKRIVALVRESFGRIDKPELLAMIFTPVMIWMLNSERTREHEWAIYDDFKFLVVAIIVMYGFGLKQIINAILLIKGVNVEDDNKKDRDSVSAGTGNSTDLPSDTERS